MIVFDLKCGQDHVFEAWFASSDSYAAQKERGLVTCAMCGSTEVDKAVMAPAVPTKGNRLPSAASTSSRAQQLQALRSEIEASCDYVGRDFAREARARAGARADANAEQPKDVQRGIYGEASLAEAADLVADGIPVAPLPFLPRRRADA
jgi:hypothetical protein